MWSMQQAHFWTCFGNKNKGEESDIDANANMVAAQPDQWFVSTGDPVSCWHGGKISFQCSRKVAKKRKKYVVDCDDNRRSLVTSS